MKKHTIITTLMVVMMPLYLMAQKKPLDHSVYDAWQSIAGETLTDDGRFSVFNINAQEGDGTLNVVEVKTGNTLTVPRGYQHIITPNQQQVVFLIKPLFADTREARIKKKKTDEMPNDSLGIVVLSKSDIVSIPNVKSFKMGKKTSDYLAYLSIPVADTTGGQKEPAKDDKQGNPLVVRNLKNGAEDTIQNVVNYIFSENGRYLAATIQPAKKDSLSTAGVVFYNLAKKQLDTITSGKGEYKLPVFDEKCTQLAFLADCDTAKVDPKDFELYHYKIGTKQAVMVADSGMNGMPVAWGVGEHFAPYFSENGERLYFGTAPVMPPKDTTIVDFEVAKLDIWHYNEPYLQPMQLKNLDKDLKKTYLSVINTNNLSKIIPLGTEQISEMSVGDKGNAQYAIALSDEKYRVEVQWMGNARTDVYTINVANGSSKLISEALSGRVVNSPKGKYVVWYDLSKRQYYSYSIETQKTVCISDKITAVIWNEKHDTPNEPMAYGIAAWTENDAALLIYDAYDIWQIDPNGLAPAINLTEGKGRNDKTTFRYIKTDPESRFIKQKEELLLSAFSNVSRMKGYYTLVLDKKNKLTNVYPLKGFNLLSPVKAKKANVYTFRKENFNTSPNVYVTNEWKTEREISRTNPQMNDYNWGTAEMVSWTTDDGITAEGVLYKPEDFDPSKKYPTMVYFYEKYSNDLYRYFPPAPSRSTINYPFFVSRGYLVFVPDIYYTDGYPGQSAYKSIIPGVNSLKQNSWVDADNIAIQGQSWGGYQVSYLITQTNMFKAAGAGAPVVNMTSAYGGIRWGTGMNRQFQYERTQSRIGKTLWEDRDLYIDNSPLFFADKVETPLLIMHNDQDDAVPWYQGIEYFTALRRLGKTVWMLQYNNEAHNLKGRANAKDLSIRLQQFFDHYLKGDPMPEWMKTGVPATKKGRTWGYELVE